MCDGSHQQHNAETGDNVGPLVLKPMGGGPAAPAPAPPKLTETNDDDLPVVAMAEVLKHDRPGDFWTVIHGRVYDLSAFLPKHPGGDQVLLAAHPVADQEFDAAHPGAEKGVIDRHLDRAQLLGRVDPADVQRTLEARKASEPEEPPRPRVHGDGGAYVGGDWVDLEDCAERFNVAGGSGGCAGCTQPCAPRSRSRRPAAKADGSYDVVVVGAGAIGSAIARELAKTTAHVLVVDAADDVTQGATKGNSGIVHAGFDDKPGSIRAKYCWKGNQMFPQLDRELHFGYQKNGSLVIAKSAEDEATLRELLARGEKNGVKNLRIVGREELRRMEPHVHPDARAALHSPDAGTLTPYEYTIALAENAADNGVEFRLRREVVGVERCPTGPRFKLRVKHWEPPAAARHLRAAGALAAAGRATYLAAAAVALLYRAFAVLVARLQLRAREAWRFRPSPGTELGGEAVDEEIRCDFVVNCAGCASDKVAAMVGDRSFTVKPRMGEYSECALRRGAGEGAGTDPENPQPPVLLHKREGYKATHTLFPAPHPVYGKGVLVQTTLWGNLILGPTARDTLVADAAGGYKVNEAVRDEKAENILGYVLNKCRELVPSFDPKSVIHTFSGARAKSSTGQWVIGPVDGVPGFLNAASIDSPGIAASPAIAEDVVRMLREAGARLEPDASFNPVRAPLIRPKDGWAGLTLTPDPAKMFDEPDPTKNVVCKCEKVTEAEVVAACRRSLPVDSTQAIRKRTRAGMGGCQAKPANYDCEARVAAIVARELGVPLAEVGRRPWPASSLLGKRFVDDADRARMQALAARGGWTLAGAAN